MGRILWHNSQRASIQLILFFLLLNPFFAGAQDWPSWRGPNRNGITEDKNWAYQTLTDKPKILWQRNVGKGYSSVTVVGDYLYTMGNNGQVNKVLCINTHSGEGVWSFEFESADRYHYGSLSTPVYDNNYIYISERNGQVYCLDAKTGKQIWYVNIIDEFKAEKPKYGFSGSPVIENDLVILNAGGQGIALNKRNGKKVWGSGTGKAGYATPVIYEYKGEKCAMIFSHRCLNAVKISNGELLWSFPWVFSDGADSPDPVVVGNRVFISTAYRNGATMIDFEDNKPVQKWFKKEIQNEFGSTIYADSYLYVPHGDTRDRTAYLKCVDFNTGEEKWSRDTGHCSIIYIDNKFIILNQWGEITIMEADENGYRDLAHAKIVETSDEIRCWTAPVLTNGKLYVRTSLGELVCVDVSKLDIKKN
ncbi:MAG: PQQ-binding-like beta-propeller repeat protein [Bacteroidetes bacterium]|nr:PQQ-binding-like beta-propeller repeat protein [Bacteroidota bacterium]